MPFKEIFIGKKIEGNPEFILMYITKFKTHRLEVVEWYTRRIRGDFIDYEIEKIMEDHDTRT